jgi:hypothetical protein
VRASSGSPLSLESDIDMTGYTPAEVRAWLTGFLETVDTAGTELRAERTERAARPTRIRRQPSAARPGRRRGPPEAACQTREDRAFDALAAAKLEAMAAFRKTALRVALAVEPEV